MRLRAARAAVVGEGDMGSGLWWERRRAMPVKDGSRSPLVLASSSLSLWSLSVLVVAAGCSKTTLIHYPLFTPIWWGGGGYSLLFNTAATELDSQLM